MKGDEAVEICKVLTNYLLFVIRGKIHNQFFYDCT